jgi:hypothetical protein
LIFQTEQETESRAGIDPHQDGITRREDLVQEADADAGAVVLLVDSAGLRAGAVNDVVHASQGALMIEDVRQQFDHAAGRTMADQNQAQDQLPQPRLGDREVEEDVIGSGQGSEGLAEDRFGGVNLLIDELPADLVLTGQPGDRFGPGERLDGQFSSRLRQESLGGTRGIDMCGRGPAWADADGRGEIALRD